MDSIAPPFWSWPGILALSSVLILIGWLLDWLLRRAKKQYILAQLRGLEDTLKRMPITDGKIFSAVFGWKKSFFEKNPKPNGRETRSILGKVLVRLYKVGDIGFHGIARLFYTVLCCQVLVFVLMFLYPAIYSLFAKDFSGELLAAISTLFGALMVPYLLLPVIIMLRLFLDAIRILAGLGPASSWLFKAEDLIVSKIYPSAAISGIATTVALSIGILMASHPPVGPHIFGWRIPSDSPLWIALREPKVAWIAALGTINFVFDLATILISVKLLRWMVNRGKGMSLIATADCFSSAGLTLVLFAVLASAVLESDSGLLQNLDLSWKWFTGVLMLQRPSENLDWLLTPVLLTTFMPVALYSLAVIGLGFIVRPFFRIAGYFCGLLGEKENTPFRELAGVLSLFLATGKFWAEWPWFVHAVRRILESLS